MANERGDVRRKEMLVFSRHAVRPRARRMRRRHAPARLSSRGRDARSGPRRRPAAADARASRVPRRALRRDRHDDRHDVGPHDVSAREARERVHVPGEDVPRRPPLQRPDGGDLRSEGLPRRGRHEPRLLLPRLAQRRRRHARAVQGRRAGRGERRECGPRPPRGAEERARLLRGKLEETGDFAEPRLRRALDAEGERRDRERRSPGRSSLPGTAGRTGSWRSS